MAVDMATNQVEYNEKGQVLVPPAGQGVDIVNKVYSSYAEQMEAEEEYLRENGWECTGQRDRSGKHFWQDPEGAGQKGSTPGPVIKLPQQGGGFETVQQWAVPSAQWYHAHDRAVAIQHQRDRAVGKHESIQDRVNRLGKVVDNNQDAIRKFFVEVERWMKRQVPDKPDNVRAELMNMKQSLYNSLAVCKRALIQPVKVEKTEEE